MAGFLRCISRVFLYNVHEMLVAVLLFTFQIGLDGLGIFFNLGEVDDEGKARVDFIIKRMMEMPVVNVLADALCDMGMGEHKTVVAELSWYEETLGEHIDVFLVGETDTEVNRLVQCLSLLIVERSGKAVEAVMSALYVVNAGDEAIGLVV